MELEAVRTGDFIVQLLLYAGESSLAAALAPLQLSRPLVCVYFAVMRNDVRLEDTSRLSGS